MACQTIVLIHKKYFGTDGIRGTVGDRVINPEFMLKLGWAAGKILAQDEAATILIGKDTRISGYMLESALEAGLSAAGVNTVLLGPMPTPAIAYLTRSVRASAGIVISASHNAYQDNGIKFFDSSGHKLSHHLEHAIENTINMPMHIETSEKLGKAIRMVDAGGRYIEFCKSTFPSHLNLKNLHIVVDCANGAAYHVAPRIFHELGATVTAIADVPDGFNINQACGAVNTALLQNQVKACHAHVGIALDGDGDRVIMSDDTGEIVDGDELLAIIALHPRPGNRAPRQGVVGTVMSNLGLEQAIQARGLQFVRAGVGDRYVLEKLQEQGWSLGGESSGHIVDLDYTTTGDGIVTALQILRIMHETDQPLSVLKQVMHKRPQVLINLAVRRPWSQAELDSDVAITAIVHSVQKELQDRGRVLLRLSGTEPLIRLMVEGNDLLEVQSAATRLADAIASQLLRFS